MPLERRGIVKKTKAFIPDLEEGTTCVSVYCPCRENILCIHAVYSISDGHKKNPGPIILRLLNGEAPGLISSSWFLRRSRSHLARSLSKEPVIGKT